MKGEAGRAVALFYIDSEATKTKKRETGHSYLKGDLRPDVDEGFFSREP